MMLFLALFCAASQLLDLLSDASCRDLEEGGVNVAQGYGTNHCCYAECGVAEEQHANHIAVLYSLLSHLLWNHYLDSPDTIQEVECLHWEQVVSGSHRTNRRRPLSSSCLTAGPRTHTVIG